MQLNISTDYAIRITVYLAKQEDIVSSTDLAKNTSISKRYLLQIAAKLRDAGLLGVIKGPTGGFYLILPPSQIKVYDIICAMEGTVVISSCCRKEAGLCNKETDGSCCMHQFYTTMQGMIEAYASDMTVDLLITEKTI